MRAIHAILAAAKRLFPKPAAVVDEAAVATLLAAMTPVEHVAAPDPFAPLVAQTKALAADGQSTAFLTSPDMEARAFRQYAEALRSAFAADAAKTGARLPRVVILPPGMTMEVVRQNARELEHVIEYLSSTNQSGTFRGL
jgi:hypothetical protein